MSKADRWLAAWRARRTLTDPQSVVTDALERTPTRKDRLDFYAPMWLHGEENTRLVAWVDSDGDLAPGHRFSLTTEIIALRPQYALALARWILDTFGEEDETP